MTFGAAPRKGTVAAPGRGIAFGCAFAALTLAACATQPPLLEIDAPADGSRLTLAPGQALRVTLDANPATGYDWVIERAAPAVLHPVGQPIYTPISISVPLVGAGGKMTFDFVASAPGSDTLQLDYRRLSPGAAAVRRVRVEVVVQPVVQ